MWQNHNHANYRHKAQPGHIHKQNNTAIKSLTHQQQLSNDPDSPGVPPLLDLSLQVNALTHRKNSLSIPSSTSRKGSYNPYIGKVRDSHTSKSIYLEGNTENGNKNSVSRNSMSVTRSDSKEQQWEKFKITQQNIHKKQQNRYYLNSLKQLKQEQQIFNNLPQITEMALQIYQQTIISQRFKNRQFNHNNKNNKKSSEQLLAELLSNSNKLEQFLQLQQQQLLEHKIKNGQNLYSQNKLQKTYSSKQLRNAQYKRENQISQLLSCLLVKVREGSLNSGQRVPHITRRRNGQFQIDFSNKNGQFKPIIKDIAKNDDQNQQNQRRLQLIKQLNIQLDQQDSLIQKIKHQYDGAINNLAATIYNIYTKQHKNQNLKKPHFYHNYQQAERQKKNFIKTDQQIQEDSANEQRDDKQDKQLRDLIINSRRIDTQSVFNRLSLESRSKSKANNFSISFQEEL